MFSAPLVSSDTRYDIFVEPRNTTTISSSVPSQPGDLVVTQLGTKTLTLYPSAITSANFTDLTVAGLKVTKTIAGTVDSNKTDINHVTVVSKCLSTISSSTELKLEKADDRIIAGMYVTIPKNGNGIPHATTVSSIRGRNITLSAASSITAGDKVRFDSNSSKILAFTKTFTGSSNTPVFTTTATSAAGFKPDETIGNLYSTIPVVCDGDSSNTTINLSNVNAIPSTGITNKYIRGANISDGGNNYVQITSVNRSGSITVASAQNTSNGDRFEVFDNPLLDGTITSGNGEISVIHVQGDHVHASPDTCTISGYLYVNSIPADISLPINIDTLITTS